MHERGAIGPVVVELLNTAAGRHIESVVVEVAPDMSLDVAADAWASAAEGTPAATAAVAWVTGSHRLSCFDCGAGYRGDKLTRCPRCGGNGLVTEAAPDARLASWVQGAF